MGIYLWLSLYILSLVTAVLLLAAGKRYAPGPLRILFFLHAATTLAAVAVLIFRMQAGHGAAWVLLSGLVLAGLSHHAAVPLYQKLYFGLFFLSVPVFVLSPSRFGGFLETGRLHNSSRDKFHLYQNVYLEAQRVTGNAPPGPPLYKVIREFGLFHKTLRRNIALPVLPDSVRCLAPGDDAQLRLRLYRKPGHSGGTDADSADLTVSLTPPDSLVIRRH